MLHSQDKKPLYVRFGTYEVDFRLREVRTPDGRLRLQEKPLAALELLLGRPGEIVTREEFRQRLWPENVVVEFDRNLATAVNKVRRALRDTASEPKCIETIPRVGYRFIAPVEHIYDATTDAMEEPQVASTQSLLTSRALRWGSAATAVTVAMIVLGLVAFPSRTERKPLPDWHHSIVIGDFANDTGDTVFDGTLRQGLLSQLERSPHLRLLSDSRIAQTLVLMGQRKDAPLTPPVAREVCQRTGGAATIDGSIARIGQQYVLHLSALNCATGDLIAIEQATAEARERVLAALEDATTQLRRTMGESLSTLPRSTAPPENVTTTSLEALQAYSIGYRHLLVDNESVRASPFFERAIELDPNFAMAYARLGRCYDSEDNSAKAAEYFGKAYALRDHASERERFYIDSYYEYITTGRLELAAKNFELWAQTYPTDSAPLAALGNVYTALGRHKLALDRRQHALRVDPGAGLNYGNLAQNLVQLGRIEEARAIGRLAQTRHLDSMSLRAWLRWGQFIEGRPDEREAIVGPLIDGPLAKEWVLLQDAAFAAWRGQLKHARELTRLSIDGYANTGRMETVATREIESAIRDALAGNYEIARRWAASAQTHFDSEPVRAGTAIVAALTGNAGDAARIIAAVASHSPDSTLVTGNHVPCVRAAIALRAGKPADAIKALEPALQFDTGWLGYPLLPIYLRGQAYLALKEGAKAAAEFDKLRGGVCALDANFPCALATLQRARAYALENETEKSRAAYVSFFAQWTDADSELPVLQAAHSEYKRLLPRLLAENAARQ
jgi:DNA-binding winged helix-turn-helix (wHTH) protein/tetratricopeptide (TPR) repeat protein